MSFPAKLCGLVGLDVGLIIQDPRTNFQELRPFPEPTQLFQRAGEMCHRFASCVCVSFAM